jgi:hypothetical protein
MDLGLHPWTDTAWLLLLLAILGGYIYLAIRLSQWLRRDRGVKNGE